jgi:hypothetical protein
LYELRREEKREARKWFAKSMPALLRRRMSYARLDRAKTLTSVWWLPTGAWSRHSSPLGVLHLALFLHSGGELLFVWEKIRDIVPEWRAAFGNPHIAGHLEKVSQGAIEFMNRENPKPHCSPARE